MWSTELGARGVVVVFITHNADSVSVVKDS